MSQAYLYFKISLINIFFFIKKKKKRYTDPHILVRILFVQTRLHTK